MRSTHRITALLIVFALLISLSGCGASSKQPERSSPLGIYTVYKDGEVIVEHVNFDHYQEPEDNARVFYEIFVGSFSDSDGDGIGDLRGIIDRMDYLNDGEPASGRSLGVEGIWLTPIFSSRSYHKYDVNDYYEIDPEFGTMEDLKDLIEICHERDVKLILDLVINHTGRANPWFQSFVAAHRQDDKEDPYYDYYSYIRSGDPVPAGHNYSQLSGTDIYFECNFDAAMPELNFEDADVRRAVLDVAKFYLDMGVDGFRFDASKYLFLGETDRNVEFWDWYIKELKKIKPDVYAVAEVWDGDGITDKYFEALNCFNFTVSGANGLIADVAKAGDANRLTSYVEGYLSKVRGIRQDSMIVPFISNHDMDRAAGYLTTASYNMQFAANLYILGPGSPFIYYGEELGMRGSRGGSNTDANRRLAMLWGDDDTVSDPEGSDYSQDNQLKEGVSVQIARDDSLLTYYKKLIMIRKANPEIARGVYKALKLSNTKAGGFISTWNGSSVCVLHNPSINPQTIDLSAVKGAENFTILRDSIGEGSASIEDSMLTIDGHTSVVLRTE